jgi:hypothetical protein
MPPCSLSKVQFSSAEWADYQETRLDYAAALSRIGSRYQQRL